MATKTDVINRALGFIGERPIINPDAAETTAGKHIARIYDQCRQEVLRAFPWNFAEVWKEIDRVATPSFGYSDAYLLPTDFIRLLTVGYDRPSIQVTTALISRKDYRLLSSGAPNYDRWLAVDNAGEDVIKIAYTADVDKMHIWDPLAIKVLALWMAVDAAKAITGHDDLVIQLNAMLTESFREAAGADGGEQVVNLHQESPTRNSRVSAQFGDSYFTPVNYNI
jgi:hypothetical protein